MLRGGVVAGCRGREGCRLVADLRMEDCRHADGQQRARTTSLLPEHTVADKLRPAWLEEADCRGEANKDRPGSE